MPQTTCRRMDVLLLMQSAMKMCVEKWSAIMWCILLMLLFTTMITTEANDDDIKWLVSYQCQCHHYLLHQMWGSTLTSIDATLILLCLRGNEDLIVSSVVRLAPHHDDDDTSTTKRLWHHDVDMATTTRIWLLHSAPDMTTTIRPWYNADSAIDNEDLIVASAARWQWSSAHITTMTIRRWQYDDTTMRILRR